MSESGQIRLLKFPFLLFDAFLVGTGIWIKLSGDGAEQPILWVLLVAAILLGGAIGCLPYWIEFRTRARLREFELAQTESEPADLGPIREDIAVVNAANLEVSAKLEKLREHAKSTVQAFGRIEERLAAIEATEATPPDASELLEQIAQLLEREREEVFARLQASAESSKSLPVVAGLEARMESLAAQLDALSSATTHPPEEASLLEDEEPAEDVLSNASAPIEPEADWDEEVPETGSTDVTEAAESEPSVEALDESAVDESTEEMLAEAPEAIAEFSEEPSTPEQPGDRGAFVPLEDSLDAPPPEAPDAIVEAPELAGTSASVEDSPAEEIATMMDDEDWGEGWGEEDTGEAVEDEDLAADQPELLSAAESGPPKAKKPGRKDTTLIAQVLIGIGNKPYVRGEGPGLSLEKGVPMEFLEIGKWQWTAPDPTATLRVRIYKNDEVPAQDDWITLEPGQRRSVTPRFTA